MKIWIDTSALEGDEPELLWPGTMYGIKRLQQLGHAVSFNAGELNESRRKLLTNEQIISNPVDQEIWDLLVSAADEQLIACDEKGNTLEKSDDWIKLSNKLCFPTRRATLQRKTGETDISISLNLDGEGKSSIDTGLKFLDHMLEQIGRHGLIDLEINCEGDLEVDEHHTIEDVAIALGDTITKALGDKTGIQRYAFVLPMDETLATVALDLSGRPYLEFEADFEREKVGDFPTEMVEHFFYSLAIHLKATLHITVEGRNDHHKIEACFKGLARCLRAAVSRSERNLNVLPSTKGML